MVVWLTQYVSVAQFVAYVSLTVGTFTVSLLSLMFSFRQQMGWKPIVVFKSYGIKGGNINFDSPNILGANGRLYCSVEFEIWNRRKYPIVINVVDVSFSGDFIDNYGILLNQKEKNWSGRGSSAVSRKRMVVGGGEHLSFELISKVKDGTSFDNLEESVVVKFSCLDPVRGKYFKIAAEELYGFSDRPKLAAYKILFFKRSRRFAIHS